MNSSDEARRPGFPVERLVGRAAEQAVNRYWESRGWSDAGPDGACQGCEWLHRDRDTDTDEGWWCQLRSGIGTEDDCHLCPGIQAPNARWADSTPPKESAPNPAIDPAMGIAADRASDIRTKK